MIYCSMKPTMKYTEPMHFVINKSSLFHSEGHLTPAP